ncbi:hypothetical protein Nepgr_030702 [Nepenthes gracilis]|uniref:Protein BYPASS-related n=1 Tax=Nepenthes gracilis TaxID=150966 RepID=A0AAD3Y6B3_NEPGR|nr:hypothetical protein Nepgr_030702 [Nepenthes gracilis]
MWSAENQGNFLARIAIRRNQVASMEGNVEDLESFQRKISERFSDLLPASQKDHRHQQQPPCSDSAATETAAGETFLSIGWLRKLLDDFLCCETEFKVVLLVDHDPSHFGKPPLDKLLPEFADRAIKALDICNAITDGVEEIQNLQKQAEIAVSALEQKPLIDGQISRATKALASLLTSDVVDETEAKARKSTEHSRSLATRCGRTTAANDLLRGNFRSLSWSVSKKWSAAKQIQAILSNLYPPRAGESTVLARTIYIMSVVLAFVMWVLVAAIPCQDRTGLGAHTPVPKQFGWANTMFAVQEKIAEDWKRKERRGSAGLMEEVAVMEKSAQSLMKALDGFRFPMDEEREEEIAALVVEVAEGCRRMEEGLGPLQRQIREVFHRIVKSRAELLDMLEDAKSSLQEV